MLSGMDRKQQIFFTKYYLLKLSVDQCFHEFKTFAKLSLTLFLPIN